MLHNIIEDAHHAPGWVVALPLIVAITGIIGAFVMYILKPSWPAAFVARIRPLHKFVYNKWFFDELYGRIFVRPSFVLGRGHQAFGV